MNRFFYAFLLIFLFKNAAAQQTAIYHTKLIKIDTAMVKLEKQSGGITLGDWYPNVVIRDVCYHVQAKKYFVSGFVDDFNYSDLDAIPIHIMRGVDTIYSTFTSKNGAFSIVLDSGAYARITGGLYVDITIQNDAYKN